MVHCSQEVGEQDFGLCPVGGDLPIAEVASGGAGQYVPQWRGQDGRMRCAFEIKRVSETQRVVGVCWVDEGRGWPMQSDIVVMHAPDWPGFGLELLDDV